MVIMLSSVQCVAKEKHVEAFLSVDFISTVEMVLGSKVSFPSTLQPCPVFYT